jgi:hypothetical protein
VHTALIAILDAARDAGLEVDVHDDGEYWETRSRTTLLRRVGTTNHIVAALGAAR